MEHKGGAGLWIILIIAAAYIYVSYINPTFLNSINIHFGSTPAPAGNATVAPLNNSPSSLSIAFWNLEAFGPTKAADANIMQTVANDLVTYDITLVQEVRDSSNITLTQLCALINNSGYRCIPTPPKGTDKEQYAIIMNSKTTYVSQEELWGAFEREPSLFTLNWKGRQLHVVVEHIKPTAAESELVQLQLLLSSVSSRGNIIAGGDFNAGCSYYTTPFHTLPPNYSLLIQDTADTTATPSLCPYDRIMVSNDMGSLVTGSGIAPIDYHISDHDIVYVTLSG